MQTQTHTTTQSSKSFLQALLYEIKLAFFTISFVFFCVCAIVGAWYISQMFHNNSYKAVVFFLDLIAVSNIATKYLIWVITS